MHLAVGDVNEDGWADVLATNPSSDSVGIARRQGDSNAPTEFFLQPDGSVRALRGADPDVRRRFGVGVVNSHDFTTNNALNGSVTTNDLVTEPILPYMTPNERAIPHSALHSGPGVGLSLGEGRPARIIANESVGTRSLYADSGAGYAVPAYVGSINQTDQEILNAYLAQYQLPARVQGTFMVLQAAGELFIAIPLLFAPEPTGGTKVLAGVSALHGLDTLQAGARTLWDNEAQRTLTAQGATGAFLLLGVGDSNAAIAGDALDFAAGVVGPAGLGIRTASAVTGVRNGVVAASPLDDALRATVPWQYGNTGRALGTTDKFGNITIRPGLSGQLLESTLRHESVHRFLSPRFGPFLTMRADALEWGYNNSHLLRYLEEGLAESYASRSLRQGFLIHPFNPAYRLSMGRIAAEGTGYIMILSGSGYVIYQISSD